ncbi:MAG TPA: hypothetical protein VMU16_05500 [Candidatus Binataceae bacterium]|nr:hypothetical protein [Candidatus Binataceae bacterium]
MAAILAASALVYSGSLRNQFVYDDRYTIVTNHRLADWSFIWKSFGNDAFWFADWMPQVRTPIYRPILDLWFWLNFHLFGLRPAGWHAAAIALNLVAVWLVFRVASALTSESTTALIAAGLFALMPIHAEAVVWSSAASLLLCATFELAAFYVYLFFSGPRRAMPLTLFACALLSHETAAVFPILIAAHAFLLRPHDTDGSYRSEIYVAVAAAWPYAAEVAGYFAIRFLVLGSLLRTNLDVHASVAARDIALLIPGVLSRVAMLLVIPSMAGPSFPLHLAEDAASPEFYLPVASLAALFVLTLILLRRHPHRRLHLFCAAWIALAAMPVASLSKTGILLAVQNRYLYFPSVGLCIMAADLMIGFSRRGGWRTLAAKATAVAAGAYFAVMLFSVQRFWRDDVALHGHCVDNAPDSAFCRNLLASALAERGELRQARYQFEQAVALDPAGEWNAFHELARIDARLGDKVAAEMAMGEWVKRLTPPTAGAYAELALAADAAGDAKTADTALANAAKSPGGTDAATIARAQILFRHGDFKGAADLLNDLLRRNPRNAQALSVLQAVRLSADSRH